MIFRSWMDWLMKVRYRVIWHHKSNKTLSLVLSAQQINAHITGDWHQYNASSRPELYSTGGKMILIKIFEFSVDTFTGSGQSWLSISSSAPDQHQASHGNQLLQQNQEEKRQQQLLQRPPWSSVLPGPGGACGSPASLEWPGLPLQQRNHRVGTQSESTQQYVLIYK